MIDGQTTDKRSLDTNPETPRLLLEDKFTLLYSSYAAVTGGYLTTETIELTELNDLGNRIKGFDPETLTAEVMMSKKLTPGGQVDDYFYPVPYVAFNNYSTGEVDEWASFYLQNTYVIADNTYASYLTISHFLRTQPTRDRQFSYKIFSKVFQFDDVS